MRCVFYYNNACGYCSGCAAERITLARREREIERARRERPVDELEARRQIAAGVR